MRATWNTGCLYTASGQRIGCEVIPAQSEEGVVKVVFVDIDRCVDGEFPVTRAPLDSFRLQLLVQACYDAGNYTFVRDYSTLQRLRAWTVAKCPADAKPSLLIEEVDHARHH